MFGHHREVSDLKYEHCYAWVSVCGDLSQTHSVKHIMSFFDAKTENILQNNEKL